MRGYITAIAVAQSIPDLLCERWCLAGLAELDRITGALSSAVIAHEELAKEFAADRDARGFTWAISGLAQIHLHLGDLHRSEDYFLRGHALAVKILDQVTAAYCLRGLAEVALRRHDVTKARQLIEQPIKIFAEVHYEVGRAYAERTLSHIELLSDRPYEALQHALAARESFRRVGATRGLNYMRQTMAALETTLYPGSKQRQEAGILGRGHAWLAPLPRSIASRRVVA